MVKSDKKINLKVILIILITLLVGLVVLSINRSLGYKTKAAWGKQMCYNVKARCMSGCADNNTGNTQLKRCKEGCLAVFRECLRIQPSLLEQISQTSGNTP